MRSYDLYFESSRRRAVWRVASRPSLAWLTLALVAGAATARRAAASGAAPVASPIAWSVAPLAPPPSPLVCQDIGTCSGGSYVEPVSCPSPKGYAPDSWNSAVMCGAVGDACAGVGDCQGALYCNSSGCLDADDPRSSVLCGGRYSFGNGVGSCSGSSFCDDAGCYAPGSPVSMLFCNVCKRSQCGPVANGCGQTFCEDGALRDSCTTYPAGSELAINCCPQGARTFQKYLQNPQGSVYDHVGEGIELPDHGFVSVGFGTTGALAIRSDKSGEALWAKSYGMAPGDGNGFSAAMPLTSGLVLAGQRAVVKTLKDGTVQWARSLPYHDSPIVGLAGTSDLGIMIAGTMVGPPGGPPVLLYLIKMTNWGSVAWAKSYSGDFGIQTLHSLVRMDSGYALFAHGMPDTGGAGGWDHLVLRVDDSGNPLWGKSFGTTGDDGEGSYRSRVTATPDGGFAIASYAQLGFGDLDIFVSKHDASGNVQWARAFGGGASDRGNAIGSTATGLFVIGEERSLYNGWFLLSLAYDGQLRWARGLSHDALDSYIGGGATYDGGAFVVTEKHWTPIPHHSAMLIRTDTLGHTPGCCDSEDLTFNQKALALTAATRSVTATSFTPSQTSPSISATTLPRTTQALCSSDSAYLCGGPQTGACLCNP